jgi:hypothetical protein
LITGSFFWAEKPNLLFHWGSSPTNTFLFRCLLSSITPAALLADYCQV